MVSEPGSEAHPKHQTRHGREHLDIRIRLMPRAMLAAVLALLMLAVLAGIWGVTGTVQTKVAGSGLITPSDAEFILIQSDRPARVKRLRVNPGQVVEAGTVVAELDLPDLENDIAVSRAALLDIAEQLEHARNRTAAALTQAEQSSGQILSQLDARQARLEDELETIGALSTTSADAAQQHRARLAIISDITQLELERAKQQQAFEDQTARASDTVETLATQADAAQRDLDRLLSIWDSARFARAAQTGVIDEIRVNPGQNLTRSTIIATMITGGSGAEALVLLAAKNARRVQPGMPVYVVPSSVNEVEFGSIRGSVLDISDQPVSEAFVQTKLGNPQLAEQLLANGDMYFARIGLEQSETTASGFTWWFGQGPNFEIRTGSLVRIHVLLAEQPPITLLFPAFKSETKD